MLPQNDRGMQKPRGAHSLGNRDQIAGRVEQPDERPGIGIRGWRSGRLQVTTVKSSLQPLGVERDRREAGQHLRERHDTSRRGLRIPLGCRQRDRVVERTLAAARAPECDQMSTRSESFTEIVGQRPNVEATGAVERQRHVVGVEVCDDETIHRHERRCRRAVNILIGSDTGPTPIRPWSDTCRTLPCEFVAATAADFLCGEQGRLLQKLTAKRVKRAIDHLGRRQWTLVPRADLCAVLVGRLGCKAETDDRFV